MFIYTAKLTRAKLAILVGVAFVLLMGIILAASGLKNRSADTLGSSTDICYTGIRSNDDRVELLNALGWEVLTDPVAIEEVIIPETFDEIYDRYNALQIEQGLDLTRYKGRTVKRYTYEITNYPNEEHVSANLLVYKSRVIGGDVCSSEFMGFMHGLCGE